MKVKYCLLILLIETILTTRTHVLAIHEQTAVGERVGQHLPLNQLILLTTGEHIKLYPFSYDKFGNVNPLDGQNFLFVKSKEFIAVDDTIERLGRQSNFTRFIQYKHATRLKNDRNHSKANIRQSILPKSYFDNHDERIYNEEDQKGFKWQKPFISKIDYFFSEKFCKNHEERRSYCLVVLWLDKANKFVRFGSVSFDERLLQSKLDRQLETTTIVDTNTTLWLQEFPPIDLCKYLNKHTGSNCKVFDIALDRSSERLFVIMGDQSSRPNRILSFGLTPGEHHRGQFKSQDIFSFNENCGHDIGSQLANLNVLSSNWLFYLEKSLGSKVIALDIASNRPNQTVADQIQVFDVRNNLPIHLLVNSKSSRARKIWPTAVAMAVDYDNSQLYFLLEDNRLYSTDLLGESDQYLGQLSAKPPVRQPNEMHIMNGTIFFSDYSKRSISAYKLPTDIEINGSTTSKIITTHRVLIVEMPSVHDFDVIDLSRPSEQVPLQCDYDSKALYFELEDDDKLTSCYTQNQIDAHLSSKAKNGERDHCAEYIFISRAEGRSMNQENNDSYFSEIVWLSIWLITIWLAYALMKMIYSIRAHILRIATEKIKLFRGHDGKSTFLITETKLSDSIKLPA